jgi:site-specific recombinase XerD
MKHLAVEQVQALIKATASDREESDRNRLFLMIVYQHGLRVSEAIGLTRGHIQRGFLVIKGKKKGKRTTERVDPATLELWNKVTAHILPHTLVFPFTRQWGSELFHRAAAKAGIELQPRQGIHSLRHSIAHHLLDKGAPLPVVQKALRHRSIGSTGVYLEADGASVDQWRAKVGGTYAAVPTAPVSLAEIQAEMKRLSELMLAMQEAPETAPVAPLTQDVDQLLVS